MRASSVQGALMLRIKGVPPEPHSDTVTPEALAVQIIQENPELAKQYAGGDLAASTALQEKALELGAGRVKEQELRDTLQRKLGASI